MAPSAQRRHDSVEPADSADHDLPNTFRFVQPAYVAENSHQIFDREFVEFVTETLELFRRRGGHHDDRPRSQESPHNAFAHIFRSTRDEGHHALQPHCGHIHVGW